jgi:hypothetical protein
MVLSSSPTSSGLLFQSIFGYPAEKAREKISKIFIPQSFNRLACQPRRAAHAGNRGWQASRLNGVYQNRKPFTSCPEWSADAPSGDASGAWFRSISSGHAARYVDNQDWYPAGMDDKIEGGLKTGPGGDSPRPFLATP